MWGFGKRDSPQRENQQEPASPTLIAHEERLNLIEARLRAFDIELEDFIAKVSAAAKRVYKRDSDDMRREEKERHPATSGRERRKADLRARILSRET